MSTTTSATTSSGGLALETNGINVISEDERKGSPKDLFWPWAAANVSVFGLSYGAYFLGFGISAVQALVAGLIGTVLSFLLVGFVSLAGKRGSAPTMVLSRAAFGVRGNALPTALSYVLLVGWEIILVALATLASATVAERLGWGTGNLVKVVAFLVVIAIIMAAGMLGFDVIMRLQTWITYATVVLTIGYMILTVDHIKWDAVTAVPSGPFQGVLGALILGVTAFGLGWTNSGADYSRYLPRSSSSRGVVGWTTFGASIAPILLVLFGVPLAASDAELATALGADPIGALTTILPTWYLVPFAIVAILGLVGGAVLDIYSSGLTLLTLGLRVPRWMAAGVDGVIAILGTIYVVWIAENFLWTFMAFLVTVGVPVAAWCGVFLADLALRRRPYDDTALYDAGGRYDGTNWVSVALVVVGTLLGWGLVTNATEGFGWLGYLLGPLGGREGEWAFANLGVLVALAVGFFGYSLLCGARVRRQEATP